MGRKNIPITDVKSIKEWWKIRRSNLRDRILDVFDGDWSEEEKYWFNFDNQPRKSTIKSQKGITKLFNEEVEKSTPYCSR